jgi:acyl-lipid omega-6 desaturase (Delta-12 desaturase)
MQPWTERMPTSACQSAKRIVAEASSVTRGYRGGSMRESLVQLAGTLASWFAFYLLGLYLLEHGSWFALPCALGVAAFTLRLFMIQHDCGHHSFFASRALNEWVGFGLGIISATPHRAWYRCHALHHAGSGNLGRRGIGDIRTLTIEEYLALSGLERFVYRTYRHPLVLFGIGPILLFGVRQRFAYYLAKDWQRERRSVYATNLCLLSWAAGVRTLSSAPSSWLLAFHVGAMAMAASAGVWLFYVQHQFAEAYWETKDRWSAADAALLGSSHYELPRALRWLTANIGLHHLHHLDSKIPNYRLERCLRDNRELQSRGRLTLSSSLACMDLKLWDAGGKLMVSFEQALERVSEPDAAAFHTDVPPGAR